MRVAPERIKFLYRTKKIRPFTDHLHLTFAVPGGIQMIKLNEEFIVEHIAKVFYKPGKVAEVRKPF